MADALTPTKPSTSTRGRGAVVTPTRKWPVVYLFLVLGATMAAGQRGEIVLVQPQSQAVRFAAPWFPNGVPGETRVVGRVLDSRQMGVADVRVQLRDLKNG